MKAPSAQLEALSYFAEQPLGHVWFIKVQCIPAYSQAKRDTEKLDGETQLLQ